MSFFKASFSTIRRAIGAVPSEQDEEDKKVLMDAFTNAVKEFIRENRDVTASISRHNSQAQEICAALENVLCHGLRPHGLMPNPPEFGRLWEVMCAVSHADTVQNLEELPFSSVAAKCQAWIRVALNEGVCSNYIHSLLDESHAGLLSANYQVGAFLRDPSREKPELLCSVFRAVEPYKFNMSLGELCTVPAPPSADGATGGVATPGSPAGHETTRSFAGLFTPEPPKAAQPTDWSDIAAVTVVSAVFDITTSDTAETRPRASSRARAAASGVTATQHADGTISAAGTSADSSTADDMLAAGETTPPKKGGATPKKERRPKTGGKKGKKGHQRVRSIIDPEDVDDERSGSVTSGGGGRSVEPIDPIDEILSPLRLSRSSAGPDLDVDDILSAALTSSDVADINPVPLPPVVEDAARAERAREQVAALSSILDNIREVPVEVGNAAETVSDASAAVAAATAESSQEGSAATTSSDAAHVMVDASDGADESVSGDGDDGTASADATVVAQPSSMATSASLAPPRVAPVFPPGIRDPMAAPFVPPATPTSPSYRPGVFDPMAVGPASPESGGRPRSNTGSMDWMIRQAEREAKRPSISAPVSLAPSAAASATPSAATSPQRRPHTSTATAAPVVWSEEAEPTSIDRVITVSDDVVSSTNDVHEVDTTEPTSAQSLSDADAVQDGAAQEGAVPSALSELPATVPDATAPGPAEEPMTDASEPNEPPSVVSSSAVSDDAAMRVDTTSDITAAHDDSDHDDDVVVASTAASVEEPPESAIAADNNVESSSVTGQSPSQDSVAATAAAAEPLLVDSAPLSSSHTTEDAAPVPDGGASTHNSTATAAGNTSDPESEEETY